MLWSYKKVMNNRNIIQKISNELSIPITVHNQIELRIRPHRINKLVKSKNKEVDKNQYIKRKQKSLLRTVSFFYV